MRFATTLYACFFLATVDAGKWTSQESVADASLRNSTGPENIGKKDVIKRNISAWVPKSMKQTSSRNSMYDFEHVWWNCVGKHLKHGALPQRFTVCNKSSCIVVPGRRVSSDRFLAHTCNDDYVLRTNTVSFCDINERYLPPSCIKYCPVLSLKGVDALCHLQDRIYSCKFPTAPGTKASLACKDPYKILPRDYDPSNREITCLDGGVWSHTVFQCGPECGMAVAHERNVGVNGSAIEYSSFPWHVAIYERTSTTNFEHVCAGTLVSDDLVISAAHCFFGETVSKVTNAREFSVVAGKHYRPYNMLENYSQRSTVKWINVTGGYSGASQNHQQDIALVHLETPFVMTTLVRPVCMDWYNFHGIEQHRIGSIGMTAWWVKTMSGSPNDKLQEVHISYVPFKDCLTAAPENFKGLVTADKFCGSHLSGSRSCAGDTGGGLYFQLKGVWFLRGIVSVTPMSNETCDENDFTAFTNVGHFLEWIRHVYLTTGNRRSRGGSRTDAYGLNYDRDALVGEYDGCPWFKRNKRYSEGVLGLHEEVEDFFTYIRPTAQEHKLRRRVIERMEAVIHDLWPKSKVDLFGSYGTGLYLPRSDIDLVVTQTSEILPLQILEKALLDHNITESSSIRVIDKARVPIVKLSDKETDIQVDISFNVLNGVASAELIKSYKRQFPALEKLVMVVKQFLWQRELNNRRTGGISSYALVSMTISFLQLHPRQNANYLNSNLGALLIEFLELYGRKFNYVETCIRLRDGGAYISKEEIQRSMIDKPSLLCIEDPIVPSINQGRDSYKILHVKEAFDWAYSVLSQAVSPHDISVNDARKVSILGRIVRVKDDVIEFRKWIKETFPLSLAETDSFSSTTG